MTTEKFLQFNGKTIYFLAVDGTYWIAIKPICEALEVDYNRQFQNLKSDEILSQLFAKQQMTGADNKLYKMIALPERYIYGWLFSIRSESSQLLQYKRECYNVLFEHFHGTITNRKELITDKAKKAAQIEQLEKQLAQVPAYQQVQQLREDIKNIAHELQKQDKAIFAEQLTLFAK